jgi:hypothetical protein
MPPDARHLLPYWQRTLAAAQAWLEAAIARLQRTIKWDLLRTSRVLLCTIDSVSRMLYDIEAAADEYAAEGNSGWTVSSGTPSQCVFMTHAFEQWLLACM